MRKQLPSTDLRAVRDEEAVGSNSVIPTAWNTRSVARTIGFLVGFRGTIGSYSCEQQQLLAIGSPSRLSASRVAAEDAQCVHLRGQVEQSIVK